MDKKTLKKIIRDFGGDPEGKIVLSLDELYAIIEQIRKW